LPESKTPEILYGGQAVIEGVMMRSPHYFAVACRKANGEIAITCEAVPKVLRPYWQKIPFLRGAFAIVDAMALGTKSLLWAAKIAEADIPADPNKLSDPNKLVDPKKLAPVDGAVVLESTSSKATDIVLGSAMVVGIVSFIAIFKALPHLAVEFFKQVFHWHSWQLSVADIIVRLTIFTVYISLIARMKHVFRGAQGD
jgi:uncharacterized protein YqhQ